MSPLAGLLERLPHRQVAGKVNGSIADGIAALSASEGLLLSGQKVRFRFIQSALWGTVAALLGAGFVAGLYDGLFEVRWFVPIGPADVEIFWLKYWWDNLFHFGWWVVYRHEAFRDIPEPAFATMAVKTLMAKRKWWGVRVSNLRVATAPLAVIGLTLALAVLGTWLTNFSLPWAWAHVMTALNHPGFKVSAHFLQKLSASQIVLGIIIGQVIHRVWAPVGATLQGAMLDRSVDRRQATVARAGIDMDQALEIDSAGWHIVPAWVRLPLAPPVIRERWSEMWRGNTAIRARKGHGALVTVMVALAALVTLLGLVGHYWAGAGHTVPYLFP